MSVASAKQTVREHVWNRLEEKGAVEPNAKRNIPSFVGAEDAARRLAGLAEWQKSTVVKTVPDTAQLPVRVRALTEGKILYMAVPRLAAPKPFYLLDPSNLAEPPEIASQKTSAAEVGRNVDVDEMLPIDMVVIGSVAVNRQGVRLGKGAGYSDIELALLQEVGLINSETPIATTVHRLQVVDEELPEAEHDFRVDLIVTPDEVIRCAQSRRPDGILWESLPPEKIAAIPALASRQSKL
ncbi:5-formyltetrahydrofolate cyclo-ligase [Nocardia sp. NPDC003482]